LEDEVVELGIVERASAPWALRYGAFNSPADQMLLALGT
jgi:hypothetical protein